MKHLRLCFALCFAIGATEVHAQPAVASQPAVVVPAPGVDPALDARAKKLSSRLRCPVCQGESIQDSPAELALQMRAVVREQIVVGRSDEQVLEYFVQKYGQWILLEPRAEGINLIVYWVPIVFLLIGAAGLWVIVRRWTKPRPPNIDANVEHVRD